ncbi:hypothetical protein Tco_0088652 [Tanacetum coccineum]
MVAAGGGARRERPARGPRQRSSRVHPESGNPAGASRPRPGHRLTGSPRNRRRQAPRAQARHKRSAGTRGQAGRRRRRTRAGGVCTTKTRAKTNEEVPPGAGASKRPDSSEPPTERRGERRGRADREAGKGGAARKKSGANRHARRQHAGREPHGAQEPNQGNDPESEDRGARKGRRADTQRDAARCPPAKPKQCDAKQRAAWEEGTTQPGARRRNAARRGTTATQQTAEDSSARQTNSVRKVRARNQKRSPSVSGEHSATGYEAARWTKKGGSDTEEAQPTAGGGWGHAYEQGQSFRETRPPNKERTEAGAHGGRAVIAAPGRRPEHGAKVLGAGRRPPVPPRPRATSAATGRRQRRGGTPRAAAWPAGVPAAPTEEHQHRKGSPRLWRSTKRRSRGESYRRPQAPQRPAAGQTGPGRPQSRSSGARARHLRDGQGEEPEESRTRERPGAASPSRTSNQPG